MTHHCNSGVLFKELHHSPILRVLLNDIFLDEILYILLFLFYTIVIFYLVAVFSQW